MRESDRQTNDTETPQDLDEAAVAWLVCLRSGQAKPQDRMDFLAWRGRSAAHERAALGAESLWQDIGLTAAAEAHGKHARRPAATGFIVKSMSFAAAGMIAALLGAAAFDRYWPAGGVAALLADIRTDIGERRSLQLVDGSTLNLNAGTAIDIEMRSDVRRIVLHAGEIGIDVAADAARPFAVMSAGGAAVALGTIYDVRRVGDMTTVTVSESRVRVAFPVGLSNADREARVIEAGEQLRYGPGRGLGAPEKVDADSVTAWRRGRLIFDDARLEDVVTEVNRQRSGRIVIADARLRDLKVTGLFDLDAPDAVLDTIGRTLPVRVVKLPYLTVLR